MKKIRCSFCIKQDNLVNQQRRSLVESRIQQQVSELGKSLGVETLEDWYNITKRDVMVNRANRSILKPYGNSLKRLLPSVFPEHDWVVWRFAEFPKELEQPCHRKEYLDWLGDQLGIKKMDDWYTVRAHRMADKGGSRLLLLYSNSLFRMLSEIYSDHAWKPWRFEQPPKRLWDDFQSQRDCLEWMRSKLGVKGLEDWYKVTTREFGDKGGRSLLYHYGNSLIKLLSSLYPHHEWMAWRFGGVPNGFWDNEEEQRRFVGWLTGKLELKSLNDWYRVSRKQIEEISPISCFRKHGGIPEVLRRVYPQHKWDWEIPGDPRHLPKTSQWRLRKTVEKIFPNQGDHCHFLTAKVVYEDYFPPELLYSSGQPMQVDVYLPNARLGFEYHGVHHFKELHIFGPQEQYSQRDTEKRSACAAKGITLIEVPYWWDFGAGSLVEEINQKRPDLVKEQSKEHSV